MHIKAAITATILTCVLGLHGEELLNVSYDITREFYTDYNAAFVKHWKEKTGSDLTINQSHGGSSKQARAVIDGLEADVVTMNQETDIDVLVNAGLVHSDWKSLLPNQSSPYFSTIVFLVRKGNPKGIKDWNDLAREGVSVIVPHPKTSGNGRYSYLAAWAWAQKHFNNDEILTREFVSKIFHNVPLLETGGRAATNTFVQKGMGDVLLTFESETLQIARVFNPENYEIVYPSLSISAEAPVAVVSKVADHRGTSKLAFEYLRYLWSEEGQKIAVKHFFRPRALDIPAAQGQTFPAIDLAEVDKTFGGWPAVQAKHFADGGIFDQIYEDNKL